MSEPTRWEYVTVPLLMHVTKQILDQWGEHGYELVSVLPGPTGEQHVAYLKTAEMTSGFGRRPARRARHRTARRGHPVGGVRARGAHR